VRTSARLSLCSPVFPLTENSKHVRKCEKLKGLRRLAKSKLRSSNEQLGVQLLQEDEDKNNRPAGFWSRQCNKAECNYSSTEKEALAVV
jgi:RNase H-like domain found in reverse transcriptase